MAHSLALHNSLIRVAEERTSQFCGCPNRPFDSIIRCCGAEAFILVGAARHDKSNRLPGNRSPRPRYLTADCRFDLISKTFADELTSSGNAFGNLFRQQSMVLAHRCELFVNSTFYSPRKVCFLSSNFVHCVCRQLRIVRFVPGLLVVSIEFRGQNRLHQAACVSSINFLPV